MHTTTYIFALLAQEKLSPTNNVFYALINMIYTSIKVDTELDNTIVSLKKVMLHYFSFKYLLLRKTSTLGNSPI